ncbi:MAG TPA: hypothetical protein PKN57_01325 [Saprospiraceae bacterium]|nr:hypothetical protein [Saprospiraceae bacterium]MCC6687496.1 hypothetical protein [Saprospiraceae bacterium]HMV23833.1 hypothetical protein [Saprospiraceae bacterium]HMW76099.1 hypothetical protein [Saprospiraceae bacterium]HMX81752.1 hypothetical protein [Saprospiraceae bacterium]
MKNLLIVAMLFFSTQYILAQDNNPPQQGKRGEKIESLRIAFITDKLQLTPEESKQFWPVYTQYTKDLEQLRSEAKRAKAEVGMSDAEAENMVKDRFSRQERRLELDRKYYQEFRKVLPATKVALFFDSINQFNQKVLKAYKEKKREGNRPPRRRF